MCHEVLDHSIEHKSYREMQRKAHKSVQADVDNALNVGSRGVPLASDTVNQQNKSTEA